MKPKQVVHYKETPLAWAPDALSDAINKFTDWESRVVTDRREVPTSGDAVVHFHNRFVPTECPRLLQYHSEPERVVLASEDPAFPRYRLTLAQYHATLPEYEDCHIVRNVIDFTLPEYQCAFPAEMRIGYSPSITHRANRWFDKGYEQTCEILQRVCQKHAHVSCDVITGVPLAECIARKAKCAVLIDECVTGSYHRSGLEGLALGRPTICHLSPRVSVVLGDATGRISPFIIAPIDLLEPCLEDLVSRDLEYLRELGIRNREWMERFWCPSYIAWEYITHYAAAREQCCG